MSVNLYIGQKEEYSRIITDDMVRTFSEISGDVNPIHLDDEYAENTIFKERICHGILVASLISATIANKLPGNGSIYLGQELKFMKPVYIGEKVTAIIEIIEIDENKKKAKLKTECFKNNTELVITGYASVLYE